MPSVQIWTSRLPGGLNPREVADVFVREYFAGSRKIGWFNGSYHNSQFVGEFQLVDGCATYRLIGVPPGVWTVERLDPDEVASEITEQHQRDDEYVDD